MQALINFFRRLLGKWPTDISNYYLRKVRIFPQNIPANFNKLEAWLLFLPATIPQIYYVSLRGGDNIKAIEKMIVRKTPITTVKLGYFVTYLHSNTREEILALYTVKEVNSAIDIFPVVIGKSTVDRIVTADDLFGFHEVNLRYYPEVSKIYRILIFSGKRDSVLTRCLERYLHTVAYKCQPL